MRKVLIREGFRRTLRSAVGGAQTARRSPAVEQSKVDTGLT
jgi:hypothetical protein